MESSGKRAGALKTNWWGGGGGETAEGTPTRLHHDGHGGLLNDGAYPGEGGEAAVVPPAVLVHGVREVQVSVEAHGDPLVLLDVLQV